MAGGVHYETFYSTGRSLQEVAEYLERALHGVPHDRIVSVSHSMALGDAGPEPVMFYSALAVVRHLGND